MNEHDIQNTVRQEAAEHGILLWRNNVGAAITNTGSFVRFGLGNDSAEMNKIIKSADLIGIRPVVVTQDMVGRTLGVFCSREIKKPGFKLNRNPAIVAQLRWHDLVLQYGGDAAFACGLGSFE